MTTTFYFKVKPKRLHFLLAWGDLLTKRYADEAKKSLAFEGVETERLFIFYCEDGQYCRGEVDHEGTIKKPEDTKLNRHHRQVLNSCLVRITEDQMPKEYQDFDVVYNIKQN